VINSVGQQSLLQIPRHLANPPVISATATVPGHLPSAVFVLVPWHLNKFVYFYIIFDGGLGESGGHENTMKTREIGGLYFHLKRGSRPGPTKLSRALSAERGHRAGRLAQF